MSTAFKKAQDTVQRLEDELPELQAGEASAHGPKATQWSADVSARLAELHALGVDKLRKKALETDPEKKVFGAAMSAKVLAMADRHDKVQTSFEALSAKAKAAVAAEQARQQEKADKASKEAAAKADKEAARKAAQEAAAEQERQAELAAAAAQKAEAEEGARRAEEALKAKRAAEEEAARKEAERNAEAASRAEAQRREQEAAAAAAAAAARNRQEEEAAAAAKTGSAAASGPHGAGSGTAPGAGTSVGVGASSGAVTPALQTGQPSGQQQQQQAQTPSAAARPADAAASPAAAAHAPAWAAPAVHHVTRGAREVDAFTKERDSGGLTVVDYSASWCGPCRAMKPVLETLAQRFNGVVLFLAMDCEASPENRELAARQGVRAFPTFEVYFQGRVVEQFTGGRPEHAFEELLRRHIAALGARDGAMEAALLAALQALKQRAPPQAFTKAYTTLQKLVGNLVDRPAERKFRCVRKAGAAFQEALGKLPGGYDCLRAVGFAEATEPSGDAVFLAEHLRFDLPRLRHLLEDARKGMTSSQGAAPAQAPPLRSTPAHLETFMSQLARLPDLSATIAGLPRPPQQQQQPGAGAAGGNAPAGSGGAAAAQAPQAAALSEDQISAIAQQMVLGLVASRQQQPGAAGNTSAGPSQAGAAVAGASASGASADSAAAMDADEDEDEDMDPEMAEALRRSMED